jgi:RND family efflux transporter MFP subunit
MTRLPSITLAAALTTAVAFSGCGRARQHATTAPAGKPMPVAVAAVERRATPRSIEVPGTIRPVDRATLASKVMGTVESVSITLGQRVKRGEVLLRISAAEIDARVAQAEARLEQVSRDFERERGLLAEGASTEAAVRSLESERRAAAAGVAEARTMLSYTQITAPFDGVISARPVNEGDLATPGVRLVEIEGTGRLRVETEVPESLGTIAPGTPVSVRVAGSIEILGTLAEISGAADAQSRTVFAKIDLPAGAPARSGQFARASFPAGETESLIVPATAITLFGQMERAFVVEDGRATLRLVRTGARHGDGIEVLAGLRLGEKVITPIPAELRDGQPVEIRP